MSEEINKNNKIIKFLFIITAIILFLLAVLYFYFTNISIIKAYKFTDYANDLKEEIKLPFVKNGTGPQDYYFEVAVKSKIDQTKTLNITADDTIKEIKINYEIIDLGSIKKKYNQTELSDWDKGYPVKFKLKKGINFIIINTFDKTGGYSLKVNNKISYLDFLIYFICFGFTIIWLFKKIFFLIFNRILNFRINTININFTLLILIAGFLLRILYITVYDYRSYNHDHSFHIEFIKFFAKNFEIPPADKGLEYPQQTLYYALTGFIYAFFNNLNLSEHFILVILVILSCLMSIIFLIYSYKFIKLFTENKLIINTFLGFLSFTPSFIYLAGRINNDVLTMLFSIITLYYISKHYFEPNIKDFILTLLFIVLSVFTKINAVIFIILFGLVLLNNYLIDNKKQFIDKKSMNTINNKIFIFACVTVFIIGLTLIRIYLPSRHQFLFVKSTTYAGQEIYNKNFFYYFSFNIADLLKEGQCFVYDPQVTSIKQSLLTYQYGTMMLGEYDYKNVFKNMPVFIITAQFIYLFGIIYLLGTLQFIFILKKENILIKFLTLTMVLNIILVIHFSLQFPSACNTDFRYYAPTFALFGLMFAFGINKIHEKFKKLKKFIKWSIIILFILKIIWFTGLLIAHKQNTIT